MDLSNQISGNYPAVSTTRIELNATQKLVVILGLGVIFLACMLPPWQESASKQPVGYAWIWFTPYQQELTARKAEARNVRQHYLARANARVESARRAYVRVKNSATELRPETLGGYSLEGAILRDSLAKAELGNAISERTAVSEKPLSWWMEQPLHVEINLAILCLELLSISLVTVCAALALSNRS